MSGYGNLLNGYAMDELASYDAGQKKNETYIDRVSKYCRDNDISYSEFQRREAFGLIPITVLNELKGNDFLAIKEPKKTNIITGCGRRVN